MSYISDRGDIIWLNFDPSKRQPPVSIAGKAKTISDIISPMTDEEDWECLK
jgi:hypothetical protein